MCAILMSNNISKFEVLYQGNLTRGNFSSGVVCLYYGNQQQTIKKQGVLDFDSVKLDERCDYYIGHVQAPTSAARKWSYETSHPFDSLSWTVIHNGVLTNDGELRRKYVSWDVNEVDTSVIPSLLQYFTEECKGECSAPVTIKTVLDLLEGTFALGIIDTDSNDVYIARQGSILHYNDNGDVSTLGGEGFTLLPEGVIMMLSNNYKTWTAVETFKTKSPFLFL
jgi:glucosamine 6-phosphate synthetase-like amidotransferase/phosphosugar isomerase protein